jgi:hypothetical protein
MSLKTLARSPRPTHISGVVERLSAIEAELPARHGVATFNRLYRWTTENVGRGVEQGRFEAPDDMVRLDVHFANLYFDAFDAWALDREIPGAWAPLFERGDDPDIAPLRFALAGMHAHINRDLSVAIAEADADAPDEESARFRDYTVINVILDETSDQVRGRLLPPTLLAADERLGELDDRLVLTAIAAARRSAWEVAQLLHRVRERDWLWRGALGFLDHSVGASARVLLLDPELPRLEPYTAKLAGVIGD